MDERNYAWPVVIAGLVVAMLVTCVAVTRTAARRHGWNGVVAWGAAAEEAGEMG